MASLTVGFDLDMTLIDTRAGVAATWDAVSEKTGVPIDSAAAAARLGPPLAEEAAIWFPPDRVSETVALYRSLYPALAVAQSPPLPGAREAFAAVRRHGGQAMVVTSKLGRLAQLHLDHLGLDPDVLVGNVFAEEKAVALRQHGASIYVGDHVGDVRAAKAAGALSVGVATGPMSTGELAEAGADLVLDDLTGFSDWLDVRLGSI